MARHLRRDTVEAKRQEGFFPSIRTMHAPDVHVSVLFFLPGHDKFQQTIGRNVHEISHKLF